MSNDSKIANAAADILSGFKALDGAIVGKQIQKSKLRLSEDDKGAVVNDVVEKYLRKELNNEFLEQAKEEYGVTFKEIMREIAKRQIQQALGV